MKNKAVYKWCFVPNCASRTVSTPEKIFVTVPKINPRRKLWFIAARREITKSKSVFFCCEDHFDLENDMENYMRYKLMKGPIIMKKNVVPHIFHCQTDRKRAATSFVRTVAVKRRRKELKRHAQAEFKKETKSIGIQVNTETKTAATFTDHKNDAKGYQKNLTEIFDRLKTELVDLHSHIEKQHLKL